MRRWLWIVLLLLLCLLPVPVRAATTYTVNALTDTGAGAGTTGDLRYAINQVNAGSGGDTINITATGTITLTQGTLTLMKDVTITGPVLSTMTIDGGCIFSGGQCTSGGVTVFQVNSGVTATLSGLTIRHGNASVHLCVVGNSGYTCGGAIYNAGILSVTNCSIVDNSATSFGGGGIFNEGNVAFVNSFLSNNTGNGGGGAIYNNGGTVTLTDSTATNNRATGGNGGCVFAFGGTFTLTNSNLTGNKANNGGAIFNSPGSTSSTLTVMNSTFSNNTALSGGGGILQSLNGAILNVTNSAFVGNSAGSIGGGIFSESASLTVVGSNFSQNAAPVGAGIYNYNPFSMGTITSSTFANNISTGQGGGIHNNGILTVANSTFANNSATNLGGGIVNGGGDSMFVTDCTFYGNSAGGGGAILNSGTLTVTNSTVSGNQAGGFGGGGILNASTTTLTNTIVANSPTGDILNLSGGAFSGARNLIDDATNAADFTDGMNGNVIGHPALLGTLGTYGGPTQTIPLLLGSPAINAGGAVGSGPLGATVPATDQRGLPRIGPPDIGAFEVQDVTCAGSTPISIKVGQTVACNASVQSSDPTIVSVDASGNITGVRPGQVTLTVTQGGVTGTVTVIVTGPTPIGVSVPSAPQSRPSGATSGSGAPSPAPASRPSGASPASASGTLPNPLPASRP